MESCPTNWLATLTTGLSRGFANRARFKHCKAFL